MLSFMVEGGAPVEGTVRGISPEVFHPMSVVVPMWGCSWLGGAVQLNRSQTLLRAPSSASRLCACTEGGSVLSTQGP